MSKEANKTQRALSLALEALEWALIGCGPFDRERNRSSWEKFQKAKAAIKALEEALAKQEQGEPVAYLNPDDVCADTAFRWCKIDEFTQPVYTTPQQRKPLTLEQLREHWQVARVLDMTDAEIDFADYVLIARDVEALYGIKE